MKIPFKHDLKQLARKLRRTGNLSEVLLWQQLKGKKFKGLNFNRQKVISGFIVDFYCPKHKAVIEIDGITHSCKGSYDAEREEYLRGLGLEIIRISAKDVLNNINAVMEFLDTHPIFK
jgi:very-short-patch-repair endonuclease